MLFIEFAFCKYKNVDFIKKGMFVMNFRPCIDIHNGKVKQVIGSTIIDKGDQAVENFVSQNGAAYYAEMYKKDGLKGGHIILLNHKDSEFFEATRAQAVEALQAFEGGMQIGGGINADNAEYYLDRGASHVIVTSYVFSNGEINYENLKRIKSVIGKENLVLDLSCRKKDEKYYIVTDRWQKFTQVSVNKEVLDELSEYCDEFLIHAVDVEGKNSGIEKELTTMLGEFSSIPVTYAGGISSIEDINIIKELGKDKLDFTIGSALDIFGGKLEYDYIVNLVKKYNK